MLKGGTLMLQNALNFYSVVPYAIMTVLFVMITVILTICLFSDIDVMNTKTDWPWGLIILDVIVSSMIPYFCYVLLASHIATKYHPEAILQHGGFNLSSLMQFLSMYNHSKLLFGVLVIGSILLIINSINETLPIDIGYALDNSKHFEFNWNRLISIIVGFGIFNSYMYYYFVKDMRNYQVIAVVSLVIVSILLILVSYYSYYWSNVKHYWDMKEEYQQRHMAGKG